MIGHLRPEPVTGGLWELVLTVWHESPVAGRVGRRVEGHVVGHGRYVVDIVDDGYVQIVMKVLRMAPFYFVRCM